MNVRKEYELLEKLYFERIEESSLEEVAKSD